MNFEDLIGKTLTRAEQTADDQIIFETTGEEHYQLYHEQDCCESVTINDICGELSDLIGTPLTMAEVVTNENETPEGVPPVTHPDSYTWTFYKLATVKGYVTIRWLGESNGYYSESVSFANMP